MADSNVVLAGPVKSREKKKWKSRWCILKKLSPVADHLHLALYKDVQHYSNGAEKTSIPLADFYALECGFALDGERHVMAILCCKRVLFFAFHTAADLKQWQNQIRTHLGEERQFAVELVRRPSRTRLPLGHLRLSIQRHRLCLIAARPPKILASWHVTNLRRFGVIDGKFCFDGGPPRQGDKGGAGVHVFATEQREEITRLLERASQTLSCDTMSRRSSQVPQRSMSLRSTAPGYDPRHSFNCRFNDFTSCTELSRPMASGQRSSETPHRTNDRLSALPESDVATLPLPSRVTDQRPVSRVQLSRFCSSERALDGDCVSAVGARRMNGCRRSVSARHVADSSQPDTATAGNQLSQGNRPLKYVNLDRFDGVDEGYIYWSSDCPPNSPPPPPPPLRPPVPPPRSVAPPVVDNAAIFCAVQLPPKRRNSSDPHDAPYVEMSAKPVARSASCSRRPLQHAHSCGDELERTDYFSMAANGRESPKPFDDLLDHQHYMPDRLPQPAVLPTVTPRSVSSTERKSSGGILARLIRRNSSRATLAGSTPSLSNRTSHTRTKSADLLMDAVEPVSERQRSLSCSEASEEGKTGHNGDVSCASHPENAQDSRHVCKVSENGGFITGNEDELPPPPSSPPPPLPPRRRLAPARTAPGCLTVLSRPTDSDYLSMVLATRHSRQNKDDSEYLVMDVGSVDLASETTLSVVDGVAGSKDVLRESDVISRTGCSSQLDSPTRKLDARNVKLEADLTMAGKIASGSDVICRIDTSVKSDMTMPVAFKPPYQNICVTQDADRRPSVPQRLESEMTEDSKPPYQNLCVTQDQRPSISTKSESAMTGDFKPPYQNISVSRDVNHRPSIPARSESAITADFKPPYQNISATQNSQSRPLIPTSSESAMTGDFKPPSVPATPESAVPIAIRKHYQSRACVSPSADIQHSKDAIYKPIPQTALCATEGRNSPTAKTGSNVGPTRQGFLLLPAKRRTTLPEAVVSHRQLSDEMGRSPHRQTPSLCVTIPTDDDDGLWIKHSDDASFTTESPSSWRPADTLSLLSSSDGEVTSPASTTHRPRSGVEYHRLDRRRLADSLSSTTPSVFTFDIPECGGATTTAASGSEDSPGRCSPYVNVPSPSLNYAEICVGDGSPSRVPGTPNAVCSAPGAPNTPNTPTLPNTDPIEYTVIDMVATAAAARVGREHAQLRADSLRDSTPPLPIPVKSQRRSAMRDKKLSLTSLIGVNARGKKATL